MADKEDFWLIAVQHPNGSLIVAKMGLEVLLDPELATIVRRTATQLRDAAQLQWPMVERKARDLQIQDTVIRIP